MSRCNLPLVNVLIAAGALLCIPIAHAQLPVIYPAHLFPLPPRSAPQPAGPALFGDLVATDGETILVSAARDPFQQAVAHACIWSKHSRTLLLSRAFVQGEIYV